MSSALPSRRRVAHPVVLRLVVIAASAGMVVALLFAVPGLSAVRHRIGEINAGYIAVAVGLEIASCVSFAVVFRAFFDQVPGVLSRRIAWVEMASGALLPGGGVTSYALGGVLLSKAGMDTRTIVTRSGGVFWLTTGVNALAVLIASWLLFLDPNESSKLLRVGLPLLITILLTVLIAGVPWLARRFPGLRAHSWIAALIDGVDDAWRAARHPSWRLIAAIGYLGLDMAVLACVFRGLGYHVNAGALMLGYLIGYLATAIPVPAGIGVLESGMAGALVLYGTPAASTGAAVLVYHAIAFWIPSLGGCGAWAALLLSGGGDRPRPRRRSRHRVRGALHAIDRALARLVARHYGFELLRDPLPQRVTAKPAARRHRPFHKPHFGSAR